MLEDGDDVGAVRGRYELKRAIDLFKEFVAAVDCLLLHVDLVGDADAGDVRALVAHLRVPVPQIGVGHLARHVENHDADVRAEVVRRVQLIERFLTRCVPDIYASKTKSHLSASSNREGKVPAILAFSLTVALAEESSNAMIVL